MSSYIPLLDSISSPIGDLIAAEARLGALQKDVDRARAGAQMNKAQWDFFRQKVFGADDQDIQGPVATPGKEAITQEYKEKATMCQTPQQLDALRAAYRGRV